MSLAQLSLVAPAPIQVVAITRAEANDLLITWRHYLGPCLRPFGVESYALLVDDEPVSVAVSASTVSAKVGGPSGVLDRREVVELARLCSGEPWATADCGEISAPCEGALMAFDGGPRPRCVVGDAHAERLANDPAFLAEVIACERRLADGEPLAGLTAEEFKARYLTEVEQ